MREYEDFFGVYVLRNPLGDCTNGGASSRYDKIFIVRDGITEDDVLRYCREKKEFPDAFFKVTKVNVDREYRRLEPVIDGGNWYMAGGNYAISSDSRYSDFTGIDYPIAIHDRKE